MLGLELVVILGVAVLVCQVASPRLRTSPPLLLIVVGILLGFVPTLRGVHLPAEVMLLIFLPALLFWEALSTSLQEIRANLRPIVMLSTGLVAVTALAVASTAHALGLAWGPAWVLGAALAPTDATAMSVLAPSLPRRQLTTLRAESLVNDGTALVIYGIAVGVTTGEQSFSGWNVAGSLALSYAGGGVAGLVVVWIAGQLQRRVRDAVSVNVVSVLAPFAAFLVAEAINASGVLAVVVCGLVMSQTGPRLDRPDSRQQLAGFWTLGSYLLNGSLFVLIGIEFQSAVRSLSGTDVARGVVLILAVTGIVIGARFGWAFTSTYVVRAIDRRPQQRARRASARARVVSSVCGFRGAVSLAAALAVPRTIESGAPFPDRELIVFVVAGVIVLTMLQTFVLPVVVRWAHLPADDGPARERLLAETTAVQQTLQSLDSMAAGLGTDDGVRDRVRTEFEKQLQLLRARREAENHRADGANNAADASGTNGNGRDGTAGENGTDGRAGADDEPAILREKHQYLDLTREAVRRKREVVLQLRDDRRIDDTVMQDLLNRLDLEELRLN